MDLMWSVREALPFDSPTRTQRKSLLRWENGDGHLRMGAPSPHGKICWRHLMTVAGKNMPKPPSTDRSTDTATTSTKQANT